MLIPLKYLFFYLSQKYLKYQSFLDKESIIKVRFNTLPLTVKIIYLVSFTGAL